MASPSILSPPHYSTFDNHSFWDEVYLSPLRDSEPLLCTGITAAKAVDPSTTIIVEENNTTATIDVADRNKNILIRRKRKRTPRNPASISLEELSRYFHLNTTQAANKLRIGQSTLKRRCRQLGISYWPQRKFLTLERLYKIVQEFGEIKEEAEVKRIMKELEDKKKMLLQNPNLKLDEATNKLRVKCNTNISKRKMYIDSIDFSSTLPASSSQVLPFPDIPELEPQEIDDVLRFLHDDR
ncbi:protein RKD2-like [Ipomoea triloba]|uniref:protein RKD2-like n=1 Tax=Ipomoea triloba TaxID=35885 RepID=UPI00125CEAF3|nr:protein RKD2-like [Ipomoea triloba]